jgi:autotransporter translocation and assembly factor TamB
MALTLLLVNTEWGKAKIVGIANEHSPFQIELENLSLNVFRGRVELTGLKILDPQKTRMGSIGYLGLGVQYSPILSGRYIVDSLIVSDIDLDVNKEQLDVFKHSKQEEKKTEPDQAAVLPDIVVKNFTIKNLSSAYSDKNAGSEYKLKSSLIHARAEVKNTDYSVRMEKMEAELQTLQFNMNIRNDIVAIKMKGDAVQLEETRFLTRGLDLTIGGTVENIYKIPFFDMKFKADIETEKLFDRMEIFSKDSGILSAAGSVSGDAEDPEADLTFRHGTGVLLSQKIKGLEITASFKEKMLNITAEIKKSASESFSMDGSLDIAKAFPAGLISSDPDLKKAEYDISANAENFSLGNIPGMPDAVFDFGLELKGRGVKPEEITANALINTHISPFSYDKFHLKEKASLVADVSWNKGKLRAATELKTGKLAWGVYEITSCSLSGVASENGSAEIKRLDVRIDSSNISLNGKAKVFGKDMKILKNPEIDFMFSGSQIRSEKFYPDMSTEVDFNGWIKGSLKAPSGEFLLNTDRISYQGIEIDSIGLKAGIDKNVIDLDELSVSGGGGKLSVSGTMKDYKTFAADVRITSIKADSLYSKIAGTASAVIDAEIKAEGTFKDPSASGNITLRNIYASETKIPDTKIDISYKNRYAELTADPGFIIKAHSNIKTKDYGFDIDFDRWDFSPYLSENSENHLRGILSGRIKGNGNIDNIAETELDFQIDSLTFDMDGTRYVSGSGIEAKVRKEKLLFENFKLNFLDSGFIDINGYADLKSNIDIKTSILFPVKSLSFVNEMLLNSEGFVKGDLDIGGSISEPVVKGTIDFDGLGFYIEETGQMIHDVIGSIGISQEKIEIKEIKGMLDKGIFGLKGGISLNKFRPENIDLKMSATAIPLNIPDQLEGLLNLELDFSSDFEKGRFAGEIEVVDALYYKDINLFGNVFESSAPRIVKSFSDGKKLPDISLDLKLKSRRDIVMDNNLGFIELKPDIQVKGDISAPLISGRALIRENGFLMFQKKTFTIKKGVLDFEPVYGMLPTADIQSETEVGIYKIFLSVTEDLSNPKFTLTSFPAESDADILSILIFGRKASELAGQGDGQPVSKEKLIADWLSGSYSEKVADKTGLDYIEVNVPDDFSASAPSGYGLTVGKKISDRLILKYSLVNNGSEMIQKGSADYQMFENIIFSGFRSTDGSFGAETQFRKEFR